MNILLLRYNNYYNRIVKKENSLTEYKKYQMGGDIEGVNFIPNDLINTTQIINWPFGPFDYGEPDYLIVTDSSNIMSRWFIIGITRTTAGQARLELHRDLAVDFYDYILNAPCFIEKATIKEINDPAIFNNENMSFNQIKKAEYPLKDKSGCAWIVGYIPRDSFQEEQEISTNYSYQGVENESIDKLSDYKFYNFSQYGTQSFVGNPTSFIYGIKTYAIHNRRNLPSLYYDFIIKMNSEGNYAGISNFENKTGGAASSPTYNGNRSYKHIGAIFGNTGSYDSYYIQDGETIFKDFVPEIMNEMNSIAGSYFSSAHSIDETNEFLSQNGKIIRNNEDGQIYKINIVIQSQTTQTAVINAGTLYNQFYNNIYQESFSGTPNAESFQVSGTVYTYKINLELLSSKIATTISANRYHLSDSPYDMFFIPFPEEGKNVSIYKNGQAYIRTIDRLASLTIATEIAAKVGSANIYDLQLLPYCPFQGMIKADGTIDIGSLLYSDISVQAGESTNKISVMLWALNSQFSFRIPFVIPEASSILEKKVKNETEFWRLCSPNYSGVFEFSPEKNGGVAFFDVDCNYRPFNPYIHINPDFGNLYGEDWNDSRGLICGGDFSLPLVTSSWADYQLNNKNYQQMFDREIQMMETNNAVQKEKEVWSVAAGALGAGAGGVASGMMIAGPYGALAGIPAAGLSLAGGLRDLQLNEQLRNEALDFKRDMYGYQLQNIKALPQGLAKVSAFTSNNKIFPFLEKYACTDIEKQALRDKIKYNGMTIMRIGTIAQFLQSEYTYIKGRVIRLEDLEDDYHIANAIADEIFKGVFIK